ncbi:DNA replication/repair protein RecF [Alloscardovia theropitheci]|uniref:DNA replication and repair protein RecF n=1 Tax=Alloscardovia theropitheci TaxID=2496842 RepID=A0A4V2MTY6_9BIFI|nr:DNA replication/repair protein RecF [Alloscardovia theropitheci]TCD54299.1 DNA replication/repair protein RecF [Alloscardovia theropitheci]
MYISRLALDHFRSWDQCIIDIDPGITIFYGSNGLGKTNIVEAIEFLSAGITHRANSAKPLIQAGHTTSYIRANIVENSIQENNLTNYSLTLSSRGGHRIRVNNGKSQYHRDIIGHIPSVTFAPEDQQLVSSDPSIRRRFLDTAAIALIPGYYDLLQRYSHIAKQRVALLKNVATARLSNSSVDSMNDLFTGLEIWTTQLAQAGISITRARLDVINKISEPFTRIYKHIAGEHNDITINYRPSYDEIYRDKDPYDEVIDHYQRLFDGEVAQGRNLIGPHRDDVEFLLNNMNAKEYASNGEIWSIALALKMALYEVISQESEMKPILILDDVFAQLDNSRRSQIIEFASSIDQVLITVAAREDVPQELLNQKTHDSVHFVDVQKLKDFETVIDNVPSLDEFMSSSYERGDVHE